jgi:uncharacterized protein (TIGR02391 family)
MRQLVQAIPDPDTLLALEPEELGAKLIFLIRERQKLPGEGEMFHPNNFLMELWEERHSYPTYPQRYRAEINLAVSEALAWLHAQGLVVPAPDSNGSNGWRVLSRRARKFENQDDLARFAAARRLPKDALHPAMNSKVWSAFMRGEYDVAALQAMKTVEIAVREAAGLSTKDYGTNLMRKAFDPENGQLTNKEDEKAEREGRSALFAGAIGSYKNPLSHRDINLDDPSEAIEIIMLANHLLRIVDVRGAAKKASP